MVKAPAKEGAIPSRQMPQPDSEEMALSIDGAMVNIRGEGWEEVKTVCVSAVDRETETETRQSRFGIKPHFELINLHLYIPRIIVTTQVTGTFAYKDKLVLKIQAQFTPISASRLNC